MISLMLEKNNGTVKRIINGSMLAEPLLDVNVSTGSERDAGSGCCETR